MPKKRQSLKTFRPTTAVSPASGSNSGNTDKSPRGVNDLLADLRRTAAGSSSSRQLPTNAPTVPPSIREILQIPETPAPAPRRPLRARYDEQGRRLPAGPPPPRSWLATRHNGDVGDLSGSRLNQAPLDIHGSSALPGANLPARGSLIDLVLRAVAREWTLHREYNHYYLYYVPSHLKPALIRYVGSASDEGITRADLRTILKPPEDVTSTEVDDTFNEQVTYLDLAGSVGHSIKLKDVTQMLFPSDEGHDVGEPEESWEGSLTPPRPTGPLVPYLTHLSLALRPGKLNDVSWKQLLAFSEKARALTHLSLAYWPTPCFTPRAQTTLVSTPSGRSVSYGGTGLYSHSIDDDWSEALLILRIFSRNLYALEYLDLTGCESWFRALRRESEHDAVDWAGSWSKITELRLLAGWRPSEDAKPSEKMAFAEATSEAKHVEKHIIAMRAGQGRLINVVRDKVE
ncbi:tafazzin [Sarocladium implicatum]|nr:tafazzin [Sarocladium implicatum]